jgi:hypothetical protein
MADSKCDVWDTGIDPVGFSNASFARFAHFITAELGIKMPESKFEMVRGRLSRRVRELKMESLSSREPSGRVLQNLVGRIFLRRGSLHLSDAAGRFRQPFSAPTFQPKC